MKKQPTLKRRFLNVVKTPELMADLNYIQAKRGTGYSTVVRKAVRAYAEYIERQEEILAGAVTISPPITITLGNDDA